MGANKEITLAFAKVIEYTEKLMNFKDYVHKRLDDMGIPEDPEPEKNKEHGCRIEGRLNYVENKLQKLKRMIDDTSKYSGGEDGDL